MHKNVIIFVLMVQVHAIVADVSVTIQMEMDLFMANFVNAMTENALMMKQKKYVEVCISIPQNFIQVTGIPPMALLALYKSVL